MKAFVTGGSGFVGRHMIQMLCDRLEISTYSNSDRLLQISRKYIVKEIAQVTIPNA
jgi:nucleoside-diphosphate-sugar epimerase